MSSVVASRRADARARLDMESDFVVTDGKVRSRQSFETVEGAETFSIAPAEVVEAARRLLAIDVARGVSGIVHAQPLWWMLDAAAFPSLRCVKCPGSLRCVDPKSTHVQHRFQVIFICPLRLFASPSDRTADTSRLSPPLKHSYTIKELPGLELFNIVSKGLGKISEICYCSPSG